MYYACPWLFLEMAVNGDADTPKGEHTEDYQKLVDHGIDVKVADALDEIYKSGNYGFNLSNDE